MWLRFFVDFRPPRDALAGFGVLLLGCVMGTTIHTFPLAGIEKFDGKCGFNLTVQTNTHNMHTLHHMKKPTKAPSTEQRRNVYFRNPTIFNALLAAIAANILRANSASERIEDLISADLRRIIPRLRKAGIPIPPELLSKRP